MMTKLQGLKSYAYLDHYICVLHLEFHIALALLNIFAVMGSVSAVLPTGRQDFTDYFNVGWANNHVTLLDNGTCVQLKLDNQSGSGFVTTKSYLYGYISVDIRLARGDSSGSITSFYLSSVYEPHEELDFEFLGSSLGQPIILQTNVFANGSGGREQRFNLWFDPTLNFHSYSIIWNRQQIIFYVDSMPIRVYKNKVGVPYPNKGPMLLYATLYDGDSWATDGGQTKMNWSSGPFVASYTNFFVDACQWCNDSSSFLVPSLCSFLQSTLWWDGVNYQTLNASDQVQLHNIRSKHLIYDYCADTNRYPIIPQDCLP
ncbi:unnamed protein product [Sphagnum compactum]